MFWDLTVIAVGTGPAVPRLLSVIEQVGRDCCPARWPQPRGWVLLLTTSGSTREAELGTSDTPRSDWQVPWGG